MVERDKGDCTRASDAELVRMVARGDRGAFDDLVGRYGAGVLAAAERMLKDRDDALDTTQDVFLKAYVQIGTLRRPDRLGAWLMSIARNQAWEKLRRRRRLPRTVSYGQGTTAVEPVGCIEDPTPSADERAEMDELRRHVVEAINRISCEHGRIVRLFYLEELDLPEIARKLGVPLGTAKWRLARARELLRKELMMSEVTDAHRNQCQSGPLLDVSCINGSNGPHEELWPGRVSRSLLAQQVLFAVRKTPKTPGEIAGEVNADVSYVREHLDHMTEAEVLAREGGAYRANCILFDRDDIGELKRELGKRGDAMGEVIARHAAALSDAIGRTHPARQGFEEDYLRWLVLPVMVLNFGMGRRLAQTKQVHATPPARPDGGAWWFMPRLRDVRWSTDLGCNYRPGEDGFAQYWRSDILIPDGSMWLSAEQSFLLHRLGKGAIRKDSALDVFCGAVVAGMIEGGFIRAEADRVLAAVPIFQPEDGDILDRVISAITEDLVRAVYRDFPDDIYSLLGRLGFGFAKHDYPAHAWQLAQADTVGALVRRGVLSKPPSPLPQRWGFLAWTGTFSPMDRQREINY